MIRGSGSSTTESGEIEWSEGDLFVLPASTITMKHVASADTSIYWVTDELLLAYLGMLNYIGI